jgi:flagellum-specific ATP synthase
VLTEGDDQQDPIADSARAILDGHIVLNRAWPKPVTTRPSISNSRSAARCTTSRRPSIRTRTRKLKQLTSRYQRNRDLISVGAYSAGTDPILDEAIKLNPKIEAFLQQDITERSDINESLGQLSTLFD